MTTNRNRRWIAALAVGAIVTAACSGDDDAERIAVDTVPATEAPGGDRAHRAPS